MVGGPSALLNSESVCKEWLDPDTGFGCIASV